jgi:hypothetical protein
LGLFYQKEVTLISWEMFLKVFLLFNHVRKVDSKIIPMYVGNASVYDFMCP